jgi:hypothetical protein
VIMDVLEHGRCLRRRDLTDEQEGVRVETGLDVAADKNSAKGDA